MDPVHEPNASLVKRPSSEPDEKKPRFTQHTFKDDEHDHATLIKRSDTDSPHGVDPPSAKPSHSLHVPAHADTRHDTEMSEPPDVLVKAEPSPDAPYVSRYDGTAANTPAPHEPVDVVMEGTDESERPLMGEKTVPGPHAHGKTGQKKPPEPSADDVLDAMASPQPGEGNISTHESTPLQTLSDVKLREPHMLKRLWDAHEKEDGEREKMQRVLSADEQAREGLRRSLGLVLDHVGFQASSTDALESFLFMTETYLQSLIEDVMRVALSARRTQPTPVDFELSLARFNLSTSALRPHLRNPVAKSKLRPTYFDPLAAFPDQDRDLPLLGDELSGKAEKDGKLYIPSGFPDFPSIHTYRHTPVDVATVTVRGTGLRYEDDNSPVLLPGEEAVDENLPTTALAAAEATATTPGASTAAASTSSAPDASQPRSDPKRIREAAAVEAKQAEEALRGLMRASKINKLKEVRAAADRTTLNKQRYSLWEAAMRELIEDTGSVPSGPDITKAAHAASLREEIADQSMMVNAEKMFNRKEIPRKAKRVVQKT